MPVRTSNISNQLKANMALHIENLLLNKGYYNHIVAGETDYLGRDLSRLSAVVDPHTYSQNQVWRAPKANWVYEGGLTASGNAPTPSLPSGVFINGVFKASSHSTYGHVFDFINGAVVFTSGTSPARSDNVQASYTYKDIAVSVASRDQVFALHNDYFENDSILDRAVPSGLVRVPAIYIEAGGGTTEPYAIGGGINMKKVIHVHLVSNNAYEHIMDDIADRIQYEWGKTIRMVDIDKMPERLDWRGSKAAGYREYSNMQNDASLKYRDAYFDNIIRTDLFSERSDYHRIRLDITMDVWSVPR